MDGCCPTRCRTALPPFSLARATRVFPTPARSEHKRRRAGHAGKGRCAPRSLGACDPEGIVELDWSESHQLPNTALSVTAAAFAALVRARHRLSSRSIIREINQSWGGQFLMSPGGISIRSVECPSHVTRSPLPGVLDYVSSGFIDGSGGCGTRRSPPQMSSLNVGIDAVGPRNPGMTGCRLQNCSPAYSGDALMRSSRAPSGFLPSDLIVRSPCQCLAVIQS